MTDVELRQALDFAVAVSEEAKEIAMKYFQAIDLSLDTVWKENDTPVTVADNTINELVVTKVKERYPEHGVIGEEGSYNEDQDYVWITDPIDGTIAFTMSIPVFSFCLALAYKGQVLVSVVTLPAQNKHFTAIKGQGAFMNGEPLRVSDKADLKNAYVSAMDQFKPGEDHVGAALLSIKNKGAIILGPYSYAHMAMLVAEGHLVAATMGYGSPWDAAAPSLIVAEAGGSVSDIFGKTRNYNEWGEGTLMSNGKVHGEMVDLLSKASPRRE